jgi:hypothetical protein
MTERRLDRTRAKLLRLAQRESRLAMQLRLAGLTLEAQTLAAQQVLAELQPRTLVLPEPPPPPTPVPLEVHFPTPEPEPEPLPPAEDQLRGLLQQS